MKRTMTYPGHDYYFKSGHHTFSNTSNKFIAIGCDTQAYVTALTNTSGLPFAFGCMSYCSDTASVINGSCTGISCCQSSIPAGLTAFELYIDSLSNHSNVKRFNPCSYAFLVDQDYFNFSVSDLLDTNFRDRHEQVPVVLDWVAGNETCQEAIRNKTDYACCSENSYCYNSTNCPGYHCSCSPGYQRNPYVHGGCEGLGLSLLFLLIASTWTYWLWRSKKEEHETQGEVLSPKWRFNVTAKTTFL